MNKKIIDLDGQLGNAFVILAMVKNILTQLEFTVEQINHVLTEMKSGDYNNLIKTAYSYIGDLVVFETEQEQLLDILEEECNSKLNRRLLCEFGN